MRRRHVRTVQHEERQSLLLMAAGALAGAAAGMYLARRYPSLDAFLGDMRERLDDLREVWDDADEIEADKRDRIRSSAEDDESDEDEFEDDDAFDDEEDLEPEALADDEVDDPADDDEDIEDEELEDEFEDELEDDLAAVVRANGSTNGPHGAEAAARLLEERVLDALRDEPVLGERPIEIAVVGDGVVELTGAVRAIEEVSRAAALARRVPGVSMVLNRIEVRTGGHMDTASVARDEGADAGTPQGPTT